MFYPEKNGRLSCQSPVLLLHALRHSNTHILPGPRLASMPTANHDFYVFLSVTKTDEEENVVTENDAELLRNIAARRDATMMDNHTCGYCLMTTTTTAADAKPVTSG